jgi:predicted AlkP superfamily phosphohydrolase/phosphomutase
MNTRVMSIGLDGASWTTLARMVDEGVTPNIASLIRTGASGTLRSTIPPITASAWATFQTGVRPGKHGTYDFAMYSPGSYVAALVNAASLSSLRSIWDILHAEGKAFIRINIPMTYPIQEPAGVTISGLLTPNTRVDFATPPDFQAWLRRELKDYRILETHFELPRLGLDTFVQTATDIERNRTKAATHALDNYPWDFFAINFQSWDIVHHGLWCYIDEGHPDYDLQHWQKIKGFFSVVDEGVGQLIERATDDTLIILMSDHGQGPVGRNVYLNSLLAEIGFLARSKSGRVSEALLRAQELLIRLDRLGLHRRLIPTNTLLKVQQGMYKRLAVDWSQTRAFCINGNVYGQVYLNLKGREQQGIVENGTEREHVLSDLIGRLGAFQDNGQPVVHAVHRGEEIFDGPCARLGPDLVIVPSPGYCFQRRLLPSGEEFIRTPVSGDEETGNHTLDGIVVVRGPGVRSGVKLPQEADIADLAPTVLYALDVAVPTYMDGAPILTAFEGDLVKRKPVRHQELSLDRPGDEQPPQQSEDDERVVMERLRDLGYIE